MLQVVFVHGVATRDGPEYKDQKSNRDKLLKAALFRQEANIASPMWGDLMPPLAFKGASFAKDKVKSLSLGGGEAGTTPTADITATSVFPQIASTSPASAVDLLFAERIAISEAQGVPLNDADVKAFVAAVDMLDPGAPGDPASLAAAKDDDAFVRQLRRLSGGGAAELGIMDTLVDAATSVADRVRNIVSKGAYDVIVEPLNPLVAVFLGDVFRYLKDGGLRTAIRTKVRDGLAGAWAARKDGEKLLLVGHSLGGVILYDILSEPKAAGLPDGFKADALITVGSQPGFFQELGLFDHTPLPQPGAGVAGPATVNMWINTFDPIDPFGFRATPMFKNPEDFSFDSVTGLASAHTTYFVRPQFYARLRRRLIDAKVL